MPLFRNTITSLLCLLLNSYLLIAAQTTNSSSSSLITVDPLPAPVNITWGSTGPIEISTNLTLTGVNDRIVRQAWERCWNAKKASDWAPIKPLQEIKNGSTSLWNASTKLRTANRTVNNVYISVEDLESDLQLGVDESYQLTVDDAIRIKAETRWGALQALSTLQQLVIRDDSGKLVVEQSVNISDAPLYPHRGLMIDTARNYLSLDSILEQIDIMTLCKMNALHIHWTDTQSWPLELESLPKMAQGAYSPRLTYTQDSIKDIISYGYDRGVRIVPEIDMPGHCRSGWLQQDPGLVACYPTINLGQLDIVSNKTYEVVQTIYEELAALFPDNVFHVGSDEVSISCYNRSSTIRKWFEDNPGATYDDLLQMWIDRTMPIFMDKSNRRLTMWEDVVLSNNLKANVTKDSVIMQSWTNDGTNVKRLVSQGYQVIVSSSSFFYLDCGYGAYLTNDTRYGDDQVNPYLSLSNSSQRYTFNYGGPGGSWCAPYKTWQRMYQYDLTRNMTIEESSLILGAEAPMWGEQVDSATLSTKIWPRTAAMAELVWSGNQFQNGTSRLDSMAIRMGQFREFVASQGHGISVLYPRYCLEHPGSCRRVVSR